MTDQSVRPSRHSKEQQSLLLERARALLDPTLLLGSEVFTEKGKSVVYVTCQACGDVTLRRFNNIFSGASSSCVPCTFVVFTKDERRLMSKYSSMLRRCEDETASDYQYYGARGIEVRFKNFSEFKQHVYEALPDLLKRGMEIDRIDNNGHYEPGNLRAVSHLVNCQNTRRIRLVDYFGKPVALSHVWHLLKTDFPEFPYTRQSTQTLLISGETPETLLKRKKQTKRWPSTTSSMPDPAIVSLYRGKS